MNIEHSMTYYVYTSAVNEVIFEQNLKKFKFLITIGNKLS